MKKLLLILPLLFTGYLAMACSACEKQQPKWLQGISHGAGPDSNLELIIVGIFTLIVVLTLFFSLKWIFKPGEKAQNHIKRLILNGE